jgi:hypothetical protein
MRPTGIEPDPKARAMASAICSADVYEGARSLLEAKPRAQFDLIILWNVVEHLRRPWLDLRELSSLLGPQGLLMLSTMNIRCLRARTERERWENYWNPTHFYYFDRTSLERLLFFSGFRDAQEWKPRIYFPHHNLMRHWVYEVSSRLGVSDGLYYICHKQQMGQHLKDTGAIKKDAIALPEN